MRSPFFSRLFSIAAVIVVPIGARAQIAVTTSPVTNSFVSQPPASQWSTYSVAGSSGTIGNTTALDSTATGLAASTINVTIPADPSGGTPAQASLAVWSSAGYLQSRPSGNAATILMATLRNSTSGTAGVFNVHYDLTVVSPMTEETPGLRAFYSFTGAAGSWQPLASLSSGTAGPKSAALNLSSWPINALLYLMWADDNGSPTDTAFQIDNFMVQFISGSPVIAQPPQNQTVAPGGTASFNAVAHGPEPLFYVWHRNDFPLAGGNAATFNITNVQPEDAGDYSVVVTNSFGSVTSAVATLTVGIEPLSIAAQPSDTAVVVGNSAAIHVIVNGTAPRFQWFKNQGAVLDATNATLAFSPAQLNDTALYRVVATNGANAVTSRVAVVSVVAPPYPLLGLTNHFWRYNQSGVDLGTAWKEVSYPPETNWPTGRGVFAFEDLASIRPLTNTVLQLDNPPGTRIRTYYFRTAFLLTNDPQELTLVTSNLIDDGVVVYANGHEAYRINMPAQTIFYDTLASGTLTEGVFLTNTIPRHLLRAGSNVFAVEVHQNSISSSDVVKGLATFVHYLSPTRLGITNQPISQAVDELRPVSFTLGYTGLTARVQWYRDAGDGPSPLPGATQTTLTVASPVEGMDDGIYYATISNALEMVVSDAATLSITQAPPTIVIQPQGQGLCPGAPLHLEVASYGSASSTFQWLRNRSPITGATNRLFSIGNTTLEDTALYSVVVSNALGVAISLDAVVEVSLAPFIVTPPKSTGAHPGSSAQLQVVAGGCGPLTYQWRFHGTNLPAATNATLAFASVQLADEGPYRIAVSNEHGSIVSSEVLLVASIGHALDAPELPWTVGAGTWVVESAETHDGVAAVRNSNIAGSQARLDITVAGPGRVSFWARTIGPGPIFRFRIDGRSEAQWLAATPWWRSEFYVPTGTHVLSWDLFNPSANTVFIDQVTFSTNDLGPEILSAPAHVTLSAGSNTAFSVTAEGFPPLAYQWKFNGENIPAATQSILAQLNAQPWHAGNYTVVVSNAFGTAAGTASLTVIDAAPRLETHSRVLAVRGREVHLNAQASGSEPMFFAWRHNGTAIAGATNSSLILPPGTNWPGHYSVAVSNAFGGTISPDISIVTHSGVARGADQHGWTRRTAFARMAWRMNQPATHGSAS